MWSEKNYQKKKKKILINGVPEGWLESDSGGGDDCWKLNLEIIELENQPRPAHFYDSTMFMYALCSNLSKEACSLFFVLPVPDWWMKIFVITLK